MKLKQLFRYRYHADVVSCDIIEAINDEILPEPQILLFPLMLDNRKPTETWEFFKEAPGPVVHAEYREIRKYKYNRKVHSIISMTQKQKCMEFDALIDFFKRNNRDKAMLYMAGKRLEFLAYCKNQIVSDILMKLDKKRTITFCKTIEQSEILGKNCIHSQNKKADDLYERFNSKRINHITAVNILNENANLVDCQYGIFANISSSSIVQAQRTGRLLRHKEPVIIIPYYKGTREDEIVAKMLEGFNKEFIKEIHSIQEI
jgi:superfamily II DNA or RNA helicase